MNDEQEIEEILGALAEDLINYDDRMTKAGAPPVRFVHKYTKNATIKLIALKQKWELGILKEINQVTPVIEDRFERDDKYYFERGYKLVDLLSKQSDKEEPKDE